MASPKFILYPLSFLRFASLFLRCQKLEDYAIKEERNGFQRAQFFAIICPMELMQQEPQTPLPQRPGQYTNLGWAAMCAVGGLAYAIWGSANAPRSGWFLGGLLLIVATVLLILNRRTYYRFEKTGWWEGFEAAPLQVPQRFEGAGWELDIGQENIHTINHGRYGPVESTIGYDAITRVDVIGDGTDLVLTNEYANPYLSIGWQFMPKNQRVAFLRWLRVRAPQARFSPFAEKIADGWFPQAVR